MIRRMILATAFVSVAATANGQVANSPGSRQSFVIEAGGGIVGSAVGATIGLAITRVDQCPVDDDVVCVFKRAGIAAAIAAAGSGAGAWSAGRMGDTRPSAPGAIIGSVAGVAGGIAMLKLIEEGSDARLGRVGSGIVFAVSHGIVAGLGSRIGAAIRD